ncbi:MAG TPA: hypothetical protein PK530_06005 [Anaerolineales bacterium]|nr:hypothetical protein [Anaerolineales bacterium]
MTTFPKSKTTGDAAVDGLLAGLVAGVVMAGYLLITGVVSGDDLVMILGRFSPGEPVTPVAGALSHLAVAGIYGVVFGMLARFVQKRVPGWVAGIGYGVFLFLLAQYALLPGTGSALAEVSSLHFGIAHVLYGGMLGLQLGRK